MMIIRTDLNTGWLVGWLVFKHLKQRLNTSHVDIRQQFVKGLHWKYALPLKKKSLLHITAESSKIHHPAVFS